MIGGGKSKVGDVSTPEIVQIYFETYIQN